MVAGPRLAADTPVHARSALRSAGPEKLLPSAVSDPSEPIINGRPTAPFGPASGSGNPDTPLARMHLDSAAGELFGP